MNMHRPPSRKESWRNDTDIVGRHVRIYTEYGEEEVAEVIAESMLSNTLIVKSSYDGEILVGNKWDELDEDDPAITSIRPKKKSWLGNEE